ncbi:SixA phosphatase family protein [Mycetocola miduiensis]|uniref:Phosphohistidine phosphatase n=1 Tax=Mycetocola miduiensis TaxID=995034 RepID=A0A1I5DLI8_9MICO|nr:histidine phosphatase family protein [Mycetocola miduiensis]SFO00030.1 phosphohistidine phosphatase [Mycetocola miduiensis]
MSKPFTKRLLIMRHAKSAWPPGVADLDRPLLPRGVREASLAGTWLHSNGIRPDVILCSTATRAQQTCAKVRSGLGDAPEPDLHDALYAASAVRMLAVINHVLETARCVLLVAHMPGVQELVTRLASNDSEASADAAFRYPTSAFAVLETLTPWAELDGRDAEITHFVVPRGG